MAMFANGMSYFGAAYSMLAMLLIISEVCQVRKRKWRKALFVGISTAAFLLAASGDWLGLYYTSVDITSVGGMTKLVKEYGPLHILYTVYLLSYVLIMVGMIYYAVKKQRLSSFKYTMLLFVAVLLNLGVWAVEQGFNEDFEFLSVSYIVTEVILLLLYSMLRDYGIVRPGGEVVSGLAVYDYIELMKAPVRTVCIGTAASMGAILFLAGDKREMLPHTRLMIHDPAYSGGDMAGKKPHELQQYVDKLKQSQKIIAEIIAHKTGKTLEEVYEKTKEDSYFNAEEAMEYGLATGVVNSLNSNREFLL